MSPHRRRPMAKVLPAAARSLPGLLAAGLLLAAAPGRATPPDDLDDLISSFPSTPTPAPAPEVDCQQRDAEGNCPPPLPPMLSRKQILAVIRDGSESVRACGSLAPDGAPTAATAETTTPDVRPPPQIALIGIVIDPSGAVSEATLSAALADTPVGHCMVDQVRAFRFPAFSGEPMRIRMPFAY